MIDDGISTTTKTFLDVFFFSSVSPPPRRLLLRKPSRWGLIVPWRSLSSFPTFSWIDHLSFASLFLDPLVDHLYCSPPTLASKQLLVAQEIVHHVYAPERYVMSIALSLQCLDFPLDISPSPRSTPPPPISLLRSSSSVATTSHFFKLPLTTPL